MKVPDGFAVPQQLPLPLPGTHGEVIRIGRGTHDLGSHPAPLEVVLELLLGTKEEELTAATLSSF